MGILKGKFIVGPVGPVNFRVVKGKNIVSAKPVKGTMKQTKGTIRVASTFGIANQLSSEMMESFKKPISSFQDNLLFKRLTGRLRKIIYNARDLHSDRYSFTGESFNPLSDFDFNIDSPLKMSLNTLPVVSLRDGLLRVVLDDLDNPKKITYPMRSESCEIVVSMSLFRMTDGLKIPGAEYQRLKLKRYQDTISIHEFNYSIPAGCLCVVALNMYYYSITDNYLSILNNKKFSPGSILATYYVPGEYTEDESRKWVDMRRRLTIKIS